MFRRGYDAVEAEKERQEIEKEKRGKRLFRFFLASDGDEAELQFLTEEPVTFPEHTVKKFSGGKEIFEKVTCSQDDECEECLNGNRPSFAGAYLVIDKREIEIKDKDNPKKKKTVKDQVRLAIFGTKVLSQLDRISSRYKLTNRIVTIVRLGTGTQTSYTIERGDENKLSPKQLENMLPDSLKEVYNGTEESLYSIIEEQLAMNMSSYSTDSSAKDDDDKDADDGRSQIVKPSTSSSESKSSASPAKKGLLKRK